MIFSRRRIGGFLYHYPKPCGTTFAARGLSRGLASLGHDVFMYCCGTDERSGRAENEPLPNRRIFGIEGPSRGNPFHVPADLLARLRRNDDDLDLLLIHGNFEPRNIAVAHAARRAGIPYIVCPSGLYHREVFRRHRLRKKAFEKLFELPMMNAAAAVQVFSEGQITVLAQHGVRVPVFVVPNGFDPKEVAQASTLGPAQASLSAPKLLYLGRIDMYTKGLDLLFKALSIGIHQRQLPFDLQLDVVGPDWGDQATLALMATRLGIGANVHFLGKVDDASRWKILFAADVMILTSRHDAFPTTVIEAMAIGKPVILSEETGASAIVRDQKCGFLVRPEAQSICDGIAEALRNRSSWPQMGTRGKEYAFSHLVWDDVARLASTHYERICRVA